MISEKQASRSVVLRGLERVLLAELPIWQLLVLAAARCGLLPIVLGTVLLKKGVNDLDKTARPPSGAVPAGAYGSASKAAAGFNRLSQCPR
jgi:hypothetical protein